MTILGEHSHPWFGIQTNLRKEHIAAAHLQFKGYHVYLPLYRKQKRWSDRLVEADFPLFPGYLFCRFDSRCSPIVTTSGVVSILGSRGCPEPIPEHEITAIQIMLRSGLPVGPHHYLREGERIRITKGALKGVEGLLVRNKNHSKVVVSIELLQRSVAVELDREAVRAASMIERFPSFSNAVSCY
jgi:transcription antitermination factor NusG